MPQLVQVERQSEIQAGELWYKADLGLLRFV